MIFWDEVYVYEYKHKPNRVTFFYDFSQKIPLKSPDESQV